MKETFDTVKVLGSNIAVLGVTTFTKLELMLKLLLLALSSAYTILKIVKSVKQLRAKVNEPEI